MGYKASRLLNAFPVYHTGFYPNPKMPKIKLTKEDTQKVIDIMVKPKEPKLIASPKAVNDGSFLTETFPPLTIEDCQELIKALIPIMRKHKIVRLQVSTFKKWMDGEETMTGSANKI